MRIFGWGKHRVRGYIGYFELADWWESAFSTSERAYIQTRYQPLGSSSKELTELKISASSASATMYLSNLASWFSRPEDRPIAYRLLSKATEVLDERTPVLDQHFFYQVALEAFYRGREDPAQLEKAIEACTSQIALGPAAAAAFRASYPTAPLPRHRGFEQLAIILDKAGRYQAAIDLCRLAESQGWNGDWIGRIDRYSRKQQRDQ